MERLNTKAVIDEVSKRMGCFKKDSVELLNHFADVVAETLAVGGSVDFRPLGVFKLGKGRRGGVSVRFRPGKKLIRKVKGDDREDETGS